MSVWAVKRLLYIYIPSAVRKIALGALLIPTIRIRSIHDAVVYWVFGTSRLQQGNTEGIMAVRQISTPHSFIYVR